MSCRAIGETIIGISVPTVGVFSRDLGFFEAVWGLRVFSQKTRVFLSHLGFF